MSILYYTFKPLENSEFRMNRFYLRIMFFFCCIKFLNSKGRKREGMELKRQRRPVPFHDFAVNLLSSLFSRVVLPMQTENILTALGKPAVKREGTINKAKS